VGPAVQNACSALREKLIALATGDPASPLYGIEASEVALRDGWILAAKDDSRREELSALVARRSETVEAKGEAKPGKEEEEYASRSFGSVFVEVRVHETLGVLRVPRIVGAYSVGRLMNSKLAQSQLQGGIVWGVSMALFEKSDLDERYGRFANGNLAEYHVPVNADIGNIEVSFVDEEDAVFSPLGGRGIGEIGITGVAAGIANAVHHATGKRVRDLPITLDKLL
jgi:xanthine dehydrogenase YagR molybdenum-binding subunit